MLGRVTLSVLLLAIGLAHPAAAQEGATALTLEEIYDLARARNPMLRAASAGVRATAALERSARLPPDPQLQLGVMNASLPELRTDMPNSMAPAVQLMQMVPFPGKLGLTGEIAARTTSIGEAAAAESWWEVRSRAAMAAYEIHSADRQVGVMLETVELLKGFAQVARAMYSAGEGRQSDVLRATVEVARMEAEIVRMAAMRSGAVARLNALLDRPAETPVPAVLVPDDAVALPPAETLRAWAEEGRPMLDQGRLLVRQATTRESLARRELWPDLTVGVQYGQRADEMGTERMGSVMLGVSLPVFAGSRQLQMRKEAEAMRQMAEAELAGMRAGVNARIGELLAEADRARTLIDLYRAEILPQAGANAASALSAYRVGSVDFMTLVDAQMTHNRFAQELHVLEAEFGTTVADLEMTIGRDLRPAGSYREEDR